MKLARLDGVLSAGASLMDYGCGRGGDVARLRREGFDCDGWDPVHAPHGARREADVVNLGYVVNVIERPGERAEVLRAAFGLTRRVLVVSARLVNEQSSATLSYGDGALTLRQTFQKFYEQQELKAWVEGVLATPAVAAAPGVFYVFRDPAVRSEFLASRFRRPAPRPRVDPSALYAAHADILDELAAFMANRGRPPATGEFASEERLQSELGSLSRALKVLRSVIAPELWTMIREERAQDLLMFVALTRFDGRPAWAQLAPSMQTDVRAFFGSWTAACTAADRLLLGLGDKARLEAAFRRARVGKLMPTALYLHVSALPKLPLLLRLYEGCGQRFLGAVDGANLVKLGRAEPKISYLSYPDFEADPHPALTESVSAHLQTFRVRTRSYAAAANPPILHRKEEMVAEDHPRRTMFARLTRSEEAAGLFSYPEMIGTRRGWLAALEAQQVKLRGHRLIRIPSPGLKCVRAIAE